MAAAAALQLQDRNTDWVHELERVAAAFDSLPGRHDWPCSGRSTPSRPRTESCRNRP